MSPETVKQLKDLMAYESAREAPPDEFPVLPPLPAARYTDREFFNLERNRLFKRSWLLAAHRDEIPEPGCFLRWDMAGPPVVLSHTEQGEITALINRCRHRGAPVVLDAQGKNRRLTCPYHGWSYAHDGELIAIRSERDFHTMDKTELGLETLRCETLGNLVFVNFDSNALPLRESLGELVEEWQEFDLAHCRLSQRNRFTVKCNWKIAMEANLEVYHVPNIHRKTIAPVLDANANVNTLFPGGHSRMIAPIPAQAAINAWGSSWPEIDSVGEIGRTCTQSYSLFPNLVMPLNQFVIPPIQFWPTGIDECIVETWTMAPDWGDSGKPGPNMWTDEKGAMPNQILMEDIEMSEAIQAGLDPRNNHGIPLSYQEARIYYWHQSADKMIGKSRIPDHLRVSPVINEQWIHPSEPRLT